MKIDKAPAGPALSLVIPCWNEAESLPGLLERLAGILERTDVEVLLVDNGSTDRTPEVLAGLLESRPFCRKVSLAVNGGYGGGIMAGLKAAKGRFLGWTHADLQTDPADALKGLELLEACASPERTLVKGCRIGRPFASRVFTWGMAAYASLRLGTGLGDINGQPVLFHRSLICEWPAVMPSDFTFDLAAFYAAKKAGWRVERFPVRFSPRPHGHSTWDFGLGSKWRMASAVAGTCSDLSKRRAG